MAQVHRLSQEQARRITLRAQLLGRPRPDEVLATLRHLTRLQLDPTAAVAPSADLVLWSRIGDDYDPRELEDLLAQQRVVDLRGFAVPAEDVALWRAEMAAWPGPGELRPWQEQLAGWVEANEESRREVLDRLRTDGPLPASALTTRFAVRWTSSGWNDDRSLRRLLDLMVQRGEVAAAGREGREALWDLAERVYLDQAPVPLEEAWAERARRTLVSLGLDRQRAGAGALGAPPGEPAVVEGLRGRWRVDPAALARADEPLAGRTVLLSPLDAVVKDRRRLTDLFAFDYVLEMYKPAASRRWGYWALPVLDGERLVGKVDATADRRGGVLHVDAVHEDVAFDADLRGRVETEVERLAAWLGLEPAQP